MYRTRIQWTLVMPGRAARTLMVLMGGLFLLSLSGAGLARGLVHRNGDEGHLASQTRATAARNSPTDREAILDLVRLHRRGDSEQRQADLTDAIYSEALAASVDPLMVASIVAKESSFRSAVVSRAGAVGLMQLRPWVASDVARRGAIEWRGAETLSDPDLNVRLGIRYYQEMMERFEDDARMALTAYNYGPTRVDRQVRKGTYSGSDYADEILAMFEILDAARHAGTVALAVNDNEVLDNRS